MTGPPFSLTFVSLSSGVEDLESSVSHPLDGIDIVRCVFNGASGAVTRRRLSSAAVTQAVTLTGRRWSGYPSFRTRLHAFRLVWRPALESILGGGNATVIATITVRASNDPQFATYDDYAFTTAAASLDGNGYIVGTGTVHLPIEYQFYRFSVAIPSYTGMMMSLLALDLVVDKGSSIF